ncbi:hypothetical protein OIU76_027585 [Salix suchowensis]|nr:hypothetical protein OIU76_027585 [Salix suchowensis]
MKRKESSFSSQQSSTSEQERTCGADRIRDTYKEIVERTVKEDKKSRKRNKKWVFCLVEMFSSLLGNQEARILVLGLDNAGKTTILYRLQMGEVVSTIPTIGFNVETVQYNNIKFQVWDLGGQTSIRPYWRCYFPNTQAVIYVVDSSDTERIGIAKEEFHSILEEEELKGAVVLIFANKQDLPGALDDAAVTEALELHKIKSRQWAIFKACATKGEGLFEGLDCDWFGNETKDWFGSESVSYM